MFFNARWMDPSLGRFTQPDFIVPTQTQGTQAWDRYAFVNNNPVRYNDPTGHFAFLIPMLVGAVIGGAVDAIRQYQNGGKIDLGKVAVSAGMGAVAGLAGAVIALIAAAAGVATTLGLATELAVGGTLAGMTNIALSNVERVVDHAIDGDDITGEIVMEAR